MGRKHGGQGGEETSPQPPPLRLGNRKNREQLTHQAIALEFMHKIALLPNNQTLAIAPLKVFEKSIWIGLDRIGRENAIQ
jgi:hypothetical protein